MTVHATCEDFSLRSLHRDDSAGFVRYLNDLSVVGWLARPPYPYLPEHAEAFFADNSVSWPCRAGIEIGEEIAGVVSIDPHLGFWLAPQYWGRGVMTRAASQILDAWFAQVSDDVVESGFFEGNEASAWVLVKLGFRQVGQSEVLCVPLNRMRPHVNMRLTRVDWQAGHGR